MGCANTESGRKEPTPRRDFLEYRGLVVLAMGQVDAALRALEAVSAQANRDPRPAYEAFAGTVQHLEVESVKVRERTQAIRARGDAYFEHWEEYLAGVKDEGVHRRAEEHRAQLKQTCNQLRVGW